MHALSEPTLASAVMPIVAVRLGLLLCKAPYLTLDVHSFDPHNIPVDKLILLTSPFY